MVAWSNLCSKFKPPPKKKQFQESRGLHFKHSQHKNVWTIFNWYSISMRRKTKGNPHKEELRTKSLWRRVIHSQCVRRNPMGWHNKRTKDRWWQWWWLKFQHDPTVAHVGKQQQLQPSAGAQSPRIERRVFNQNRVGGSAPHASCKTYFKMF